MVGINNLPIAWLTAPARYARDLFVTSGQSEADTVDMMAKLMVITGIGVFFLVMSGVKVVYGRYAVSCSGFWGFKINVRAAWLLQELPCVVIPVANCLSGNSKCLQCTPNKILLTLFLIHYINRTFIYPFQIRGGKATPFVPWFLALMFCTVNGFIQSRTLTHIQPYDEAWLSDFRFLAGVLIFFTGMAINIQSDSILRGLRDTSGKDTGYKIPRGGMFEYVSAANLFGEILEWSGYALAQGGLVGAAFACFTACNLVPRGWHHHLWYRHKFPEYPRSRWAVLPFLL